MLTREVAVRGRQVFANGDTDLVRTSIGVYKMHVLFDNAEWLDFAVQAVFGYGEHEMAQTLVLTALDVGEVAAEAEIGIPWECMQALGSVRVTFVGTDDGDRIITAKSGYELWQVVQEGDVSDGTVPTPAPTEDEWNQAYEAAVQAASDAASAAEQVADILRSTDAQTLEQLIDELGDCMRFMGSVASLPDDAEDGAVYSLSVQYDSNPAGTFYVKYEGSWVPFGGAGGDGSVPITAQEIHDITGAAGYENAEEVDF